MDAARLNAILQHWPADGLGLLEAAERLDCAYLRARYGRAPLTNVGIEWLCGRLELAGRRGVYQPPSSSRQAGHWRDPWPEPPQLIPLDLRARITWEAGDRLLIIDGVVFFGPVFRRPSPTPAPLAEGDWTVAIAALLAYPLVEKWHWQVAQAAAQAAASQEARPQPAAPMNEPAPAKQQVTASTMAASDWLPLEFENDPCGPNEKSSHYVTRIHHRLLADLGVQNVKRGTVKNRYAEWRKNRPQ